jgi:hypothetical protein
MPKSLIVEPLPLKWGADDHDLFICVAGYERRARYIAESLLPRAKMKVCIGFDKQKDFSFNENIAWFEENHFALHVVSDEHFTELARSVLPSDSELHRHLSVIVDISSISRFRLASLLEILSSETTTRSISVDFVYALAAYTSPVYHTVPNSHVGPVTPAFAGWWTEPDQAISAIVGLGYEEDRALGAVEFLQAAEVWAFIPVSVVHEYSPALLAANEVLLQAVPSERQVHYKVNDPADCYKTIQSLVHGLSLSRNPILLPFGPKLFALCCLLVGTLSPTVPVWRVSAQEQEPAVDRIAEGPVYGLRVLFEASPT